MITAEVVTQLVEKEIRGTDIYLVDVAVKPANLIQVQVDKPGGISIDECVQISRSLNRQMDRDEEDFSLEVSSPGVGRPFRVRQQYANHIGHQVEVDLSQGGRHKGTLLRAGDEEIVLEVRGKEEAFRYDEIKKAREVFSFK